MVDGNGNGAPDLNTAILKQILEELKGHGKLLAEHSARLENVERAVNHLGMRIDVSNSKLDLLAERFDRHLPAAGQKYIELEARVAKLERR